MMKKLSPERSIYKMQNCRKKMPRKVWKKLNKPKKKQNNSKRKKLSQRKF